MTDNEITAQMEMDLPEVRAKAMYKQKEFCRLIIKSTSFPVVAAPFVVTTANRNRWIVIFRAMNRCERKNISLDHTTFVCTANFSDGIWAFLMTSALGQGTKGIGLALFKSHLFARYRLRYKLKKTGLELIAAYFTKNNSLSCAFQDHDEHGTTLVNRKVYGTSEQGIVLGEVRSETGTLFRTYISYDMMHEGQISEFTQKEILRQREMQTYQASLSNNSTKIIPRGGTPLTLRQEKDLEKIILKIGLLINALAADNKTQYDPYDLQLFLGGLLGMFYPYAQDDEPADLSPEETDYRRMIKEVEFSVKGMLMKMQANGIKPEVMTPQELKSFVQTVKMNILKDSGYNVTLLSDNQQTFSYPARLPS